MKTKTIPQTELDNLCKALLSADADIRDIILFGSFACAPSLAGDIDLPLHSAAQAGVFLTCLRAFRRRSRRNG